ncbi:hypothetical protein RvY_16618 [Ramazzottius varieornatus]|uniref:Uncharacterized protein n=1 Tax=Ramazzottius varieornatus TaxID=947166 RepID=A0A1D1VZ49_RAMVA|nr:hypothetical protein RvY_16618 [Ramazzottius varieornatus]
MSGVLFLEKGRRLKLTSPHATQTNSISHETADSRVVDVIVRKRDVRSPSHDRAALLVLIRQSPPGSTLNHRAPARQQHE